MIREEWKVKTDGQQSEWMKWNGSGEDKKRGKKGDIVLRKIRQISQKSEPVWVEAAPTEGGERAAGLAEAELTYINLTENNVYYAANHNQGVEHIPGIPKIALSEVQRVVCKWDVRSAQSKKKVFILTLKSIWTHSDHSKQWV